MLKVLVGPKGKIVVLNILIFLLGFSFYALTQGETLHQLEAPEVRIIQKFPTSIYNKSKITFAWDDDQKGVLYYYTLNKKPEYIPSQEIYTTEKEHINLNFVEEGIWYFHLNYQLLTEPDKYSPTTHIKIEVDYQAPEITKLESKIISDNSVAFFWLATDSYSRIKGYSYTLSRNIDQIADLIPESGPETTSYKYSELLNGTWYFSLRAQDRADNWSEAVSLKVEFDCELLPKNFIRCIPNPVKTSPAKIEYYLAEGAEVKMDIYTSATEKKVKSFTNIHYNPGGYNFLWSLDNIPNGTYIYRIEARALASRAKSESIKKLVIGR